MISRGAPSTAKAGDPVATPSWVTGTLFQAFTLVAGMAFGALLGWLRA